MATLPLTDLITHPAPELVFAIVSPVGCDLDTFQGLFEGLIRQYDYKTNVLRLSEFVERLHTEHIGVIVSKGGGEYERIDSRMTAGNRLRELSGRGDIMALYSIAQIRKPREMGEQNRTAPMPGRVHLLRSLKHPLEVEALRRVYGPGFFLIGLHGTEAQRRTYLCERRGMTLQQAERLMERDRHETEELGQQTRDTFTLADVFVQSGKEERHQLARFLDMVFGDPHQTPTRDEHAMFLAYGASLRSGQLARQVGAVVWSAAGEVISTGANDVPCFGGGQYWPEPEHADRRDHKIGYDANDREIARIKTDIVDRVQLSAKEGKEAAFKESLDAERFRALLKESPIHDLTEYGRPVHAEMEALLSAARTGVSTKGGALYTTTFPCHNCAKHIVAAGIEKVVYVEPYPKSKALALHPDSIALDDANAKDRVRFVPFVGIAARRYFDLFSMRLGDGIEMKRKIDGEIVRFQRPGAKPRIRMAVYSYLERETLVTAEVLDQAVETIQKKVQETAAAKAAQPEKAHAAPSGDLASNA
jgi:deoxycytidylate deaminase